jgi:hypothetical protein
MGGFKYAAGDGSAFGDSILRTTPANVGWISRRRNPSKSLRRDRIGGALAGLLFQDFEEYGFQRDGRFDGQQVAAQVIQLRDKGGQICLG